MSSESTQPVAAIILCAGKGTRMGAAARNKVCTPCAGVPVVRRILANLRAGGVSRFVVVTGHRAESVMRALDGERGVLFAYQREQLGTGDATRCGLRVLEDVGHVGPVVVTMGDKIVSSRLVRELLAADAMALAVCGVQRREEHPNGGHVVMDGDRALGIVEYADVRKALAERRDITLGGRTFPASDVAATPWVNTALYRFDAAALSAALAQCGHDNAQGEVYLTDTIELFASGRVSIPGRVALPRDRTHPSVRIYHVADPADLLTFSTKEEFRRLNARFLRPAGALLADYPAHRAVLEAFIARYGAERPAVLVRAPGRVNLMGRHVEHRGGSVNVLATEAATVFAVAPRADGIVHMTNLDPAYAEESFAVDESSDAHAPLAGEAATRAWLAWLARPEVRAALAASRGDWTNYVKGAVYRLQRAVDLPLCGMDVVASGNIPVAAGLSSSSSVVVASMLALAAVNGLDLEPAELVPLCGEAEWFVGSRGGAGDHAAMLCSREGALTRLDFAPFGVGPSMRLPARYAVLVANSLEQAKKSEGSRDRFNACVAAYEFALLLVRRAFPERQLAVFRDLARVRPFAEGYRLLRAIPRTATRDSLRALLPESGERLDEIFATHADPGVYDLRGVALFGLGECARAACAMDVLKAGDCARFGELMKISHASEAPRAVTDAVLDDLAARNVDYADAVGAYGCSTPRIDSLCALLDRTPGVLGSELAGAGLGGCVLALVEADRAEAVLETLAREFYAPLGASPAAFVCAPAYGAVVFW